MAMNDTWQDKDEDLKDLFRILQSESSDPRRDGLILLGIGYKMARLFGNTAGYNLRYLIQGYEEYAGQLAMLLRAALADQQTAIIETGEIYASPGICPTCGVSEEDRNNWRPKQWSLQALRSDRVLTEQDYLAFLLEHGDPGVCRLCRGCLRRTAEELRAAREQLRDILDC